MAAKIANGQLGVPEFGSMRRREFYAGNNGNIGDFVGGLAVVLSLLCVGFQLNDSFRFEVQHEA